MDESQAARSLDALRGRIHNADHTIRELEAEVARLGAALVEATAAATFNAENYDTFADTTEEWQDRYREQARAELVAAGLLPPD